MKGPLALTVDETTDIVVQKQMIVYLKAESAARFLCLGLLEVTVKLVGDRGLNIRNVTCFSSDGASSTVGAKGGLRTRLNKYIYNKLHLELDENCYLFFSVHYVYHRVNLSVDNVFRKEGVERHVSELADIIELW